MGPGYITRGYKTIVNGQVVQTTDGQVVQPQAVSPTPAPAAPPSSPPVGDWPQVVTIIEGVVVDPNTGQEVTNLPAEVELIPLGLRKIKSDLIAGGDVTTSETMAPYFRVLAKNAPAPQPENAHPASMESEAGPDFSGLIASAESEESSGDESAEPAEEPTTKAEGGGFFDFLFGGSDSEPEPKVEDGKRVIDLEGPLTDEEIAMVQNDPQFQNFLREKSNTSRNFYASKGRGGARNATPELPQKLIVEEFVPEDWDVEGPTPPTPNIAIGKLVSVNAERQIAVCWLQTRYLRPNTPMVTRNYEMQTTGVIIPSGEQDGRSAGFWIAEGQPMPGDEVIVPGPEYASMVQRWQPQP